MFEFVNFVIVIGIVLAADIAGHMNSVYEFSTTKLPFNRTDMPVLSNGQIGFVVFADSLYVNGLYNGNGGLSHRASIPNYSNIQLNSCRNRDCVYTLNTYEGFFRVTYTTNEFSVDHFIYAHRYYNRAAVNYFIIRRLNSTDEINVKLNTVKTKTSEDLFLLRPKYINKKLKYLKQCGRTVSVENKKLQPKYRSVCLVWNEVPKALVLEQNEHTKEFNFVMTVDTNFAIAKKELYDVHRRSYSGLFEAHTIVWKEFWNDFNITLNGNIELLRTIHSSIYAIVAALPSFDTNMKISDLPYGLSPTGLGRGGSNLEDYEGHIFWDNEIWMFPNILLINPNWAKMLMNYRFAKLRAAELFANSTGFKGARYPWETGFTGVDVVQPCCPLVSQNQIHISSDVSFGLYNYMAITNDLKWLKIKGCIMGLKIAEFFASRVDYNNESKMFDLTKVMGPDEDHASVTNNAYTNAMAAHSLYTGDFWSCVCNVPSKNWTNIANNIKIPYDAEIDFHPQYKGYKLGTQIKQADAILLQHPVQYPMKSSTRLNDLHYYAEVTRKSGPAMTWSIFAINYLNINDTSNASKYFDKSWQPHVNKPFYVWHELDSETSKNEMGASNFITGAGGFLQTILNGYGGIRYDINRMVIESPRLPPNVTSMEIYGVKYLKLRINIKMYGTSSVIGMEQLEKTKTHRMELYYRNQTIELDDKFYEVTLLAGEVLIIKPILNLYGNCKFNSFGSDNN